MNDEVVHTAAKMAHYLFAIVALKMKKVLITGHFNVVHAGHIRLFKYAKILQVI